MALLFLTILYHKLLPRQFILHIFYVPKEILPMKDINFYEQQQLTSPPLSTTDFTPDELEKILLQGIKETENGKGRSAKEFFTILLGE